MLCHPELSARSSAHGLKLAIRVTPRTAGRALLVGEKHAETSGSQPGQAERARVTETTVDDSALAAGACRVLVVDDDPSILTIVAEVLDLEGYPTQTASNGAEALDMVEHREPRVILLDMRMPVLDGWGFVRALRERGHLSLPIVVMTAAQDAPGWAREVGAAAVLPKPFDITALLEVVARYCGR